MQFLAELCTRVLKEATTALVTFVQFKIEQARMKKAINEKMAEIQKETDREIRAKRMRDFLNNV